MSANSFPFLVEIAKLQEQILLPAFIKLSRFHEQASIDKGVESTRDLEPGFFEVYKSCGDYTLTPFEAMYAIYEAACYVAKGNISGDFVECGVWKGGSSMIVASAFVQLNALDRKLYLYDTFEGMPEVGSRDADLGTGPFQFAMNITTFLRGGHSGIFYAPLEEVQKNMETTGYPKDRMVFVKGLVEKTIPAMIPDQISLMHLDSDLFESTYHELTHLFPRLSKGGVLIIDDYGNWKGSKEATDRYLKEQGISMFLKRVGDSGARIGVKT